MKFKFLSVFYLFFTFYVIKAQSAWNASGVIISSAGYVATSNHTLEPGYHYEVDVFNNGIKKTYAANVIKSDPANDLTILKIDDPVFAVIGAVPYSLKVRDVKENEKIFVMGFPRQNSKEEKVKVTDGAISSKSGYPNDINSYKLSCTIKPGYEGAPVFDNQGNLIGIINSKVSQSAGYAIKASCLQNIIETLPKMPTLPIKSGIQGSASDREEILSKYIVSIHVSNQDVAAIESKNKMVVGQTYGGGIIFYVDASGEHGLIASVDDGEGNRAQWGCYNTLIDDTQIGIGTGQENTLKIISTCRSAGSSNIAARLCNELVLEGYTDWYLPSKEELNLLYENKEIIGGYEHGYYWSSSEMDSHFAWYQHFDFGFQDYLNKDFSYFYRPIRSF